VFIPLGILRTSFLCLLKSWILREELLLYEKEATTNSFTSFKFSPCTFGFQYFHYNIFMCEFLKTQEFGGSWNFTSLYYLLKLVFICLVLTAFHFFHDVFDLTKTLRVLSSFLFAPFSLSLFYFKQFLLSSISAW
jgi:hypothetical protein